MIASRTLMFAALGVCSGCDADKQAIAGEGSGKSVVLAVGAIYPLRMQDACSGGGKVSVCGAEQVTKINSVAFSDLPVASALPIEAVPEELREQGFLSVLRGNNPGQTHVTVEATFDDESVRTGEFDISVELATEATANVLCPEGDGTSPRLFPVGATTTIDLELTRGEMKLVGALPGGLRGEGLTQTPWLSSTRYRWQSPSSAQSVSITSRSRADLELQLVSFEPDEVELGSPEPRLNSAGRLVRDHLSLIDVAFSVRGSKVCQSLALAASTLTPDTCVGPDGDTAWEDTAASGYLRITPVASGTCRLEVNVAGSSKRQSIEFSYDVAP